MIQIEGLNYSIRWRKFKRGSSFFIPCVNTRKAKTLIRTATRRLKMEVFVKQVIEDSVKGIRVWRL